MPGATGAAFPAEAAGTCSRASQLRGLRAQTGHTVHGRRRQSGQDRDFLGRRTSVLKPRKSWTNQDEMSRPPIPGGPREWKVVFFFAPPGHACEKVTNEVFKGKSPRTIGLEERAPAGEGG